MQYFLRRLLEPSYDVAALVTNGLELIEAVKTHNPDGVVVDVSMPGMNGIIAAKRLKEMNPQIRIIFISAHLEQAYIDEAFKAGAVAYIGKNVLERELLQKLANVLDDVVPERITSSQNRT